MFKKEFFCIRQQDLKDCGPACLAMISRHYGFTTSISKIREVAGTDLAGTNIKGLMEAGEKVKILLPAQEIKGIKKGDKVQYSFKLQKTDKQMGQITYVSAYPTFDKNTKGYMYELEATIDTKELQQLHTGMVGRASVITGEEPVWKFILRKLDFISN